MYHLYIIVLIYLSLINGLLEERPSPCGEGAHLLLLIARRRRDDDCTRPAPERDHCPPGMVRLDAEMILQQWDAGEWDTSIP